MNVILNIGVDLQSGNPLSQNAAALWNVTTASKYVPPPFLNHVFITLCLIKHRCSLTERNTSLSKLKLRNSEFLLMLFFLRVRIIYNKCFFVS
jgi:hypothetical protein